MWNKREEVLHRTSWEQTRDLMMAMLQPYSEKQLKPTDILRFEWDKKKTPPKVVERSTRERMEEIRKRLNHQNQGT